MVPSISIKRQVEFYETDMAGIVHFSNYFRWMESAETTFFESLGLSIVQKKEAVISGWPKVQASCNFMAPLRFQDFVEIELTLREVKNSAITYTFQFFKIEGQEKIKVANGEMISVHAKFDILHNTFSASLIDDELRNKLQIFQIN
ncbi:hypothetical protein AYO37_00910 [Opitutia bacterium SCGC AG-212-L18]|nr:hypothetical protein AYO37_00910 [Opitutae bacterium SCGC AG-212-L18]